MGEKLEKLALQSEAWTLTGVPEMAEEALGDPNWRRGMQKEYDSQMTKQDSAQAPRPSSRQPITGKWYFALTIDSQRRISKYKARFVARGFSQAPLLDYHEI